MAEKIEGAAPLFILGSFVAACSAKVTQLPRPGESLRAETFTLEAGGKGLNLMIGARRLGAAVDGLLPIGSGLPAQLAEAAIAESGLPARVLRRYPGPSGGGIGFIDAAGETCVAVCPGANLKLGAADVHAVGTAIERAKLVLAQFEIDDEPIAQAFALARRAGRATLLNPSPYRPVAPAIMANTSILVVNRVEAARMALASGDGRAHAVEQTDQAVLIECATRLLDQGPDTVIVTLGRDGAVACRRGFAPLHQRAFAIAAVDTLGAGDAFTAGLAAAMIEDRPFDECLRRAAACGALAACRLGALAALPTRAELDGFLSP
jgi:ribokinase